MAIAATIVDVSGSAYSLAGSQICTDAQATAAACRAYVNDPRGNAWARVGGSAEYGHLGIDAQGYSFGLASSSIVRASAVFSEEMTIEGVGFGIFEYTIALTGMGSGTYVDRGIVSINGRGLRPVPAAQYETFQIPFAFNTPFTFSVTLRMGNVTWGGFGESGSLLARADLASVRVLDSLGQALQQYSGANARPVADAMLVDTPEPGAWVLMGSGMGLLAAFSRRRRN